MKNHFYLLLLLSGWIMSCDKTTSIDPSLTETTKKSQNKTIQVNEAGYNFELIWPKLLVDQHINPVIKYNEVNGLLEVKGGKKINMEITDEAINLDTFKKELDDNQMFSYKFFEETPESFIYQAILPDGTSYYYSFLQQKTIRNKSYLIKNKENEEFTLQDIKRMKNIASLIH